MTAEPLPAVASSHRVGQVRIHRATAPLHRPFRTALRTVTHLDTLLVAVEDADGATGWGEAPEVMAVTGHHQQEVARMLLGPVAAALTPELLRDPGAAADRVRAVAASVPPAANAALAALLDLDARRRGLAAHRLLGARTNRLTTTVTVARDTPTSMAAEAAQRAAERFERLKLKLGGGDPRADLDRLRAVADAAPTARLLIDANQGWDRATSADHLEAIAATSLPVDAIEQPLAATDHAGMARLREQLTGTGIELIADESVFSLADARRVIEARAADRINVKLAKAGGPGPARAILRLATDHGVATMVGCMLESELGVAAAAAVALAEEVTVCDLDAPLLLARSPVVGGPRLEGAQLTASPAPGFGCTPSAG